MLLNARIILAFGVTSAQKGWFMALNKKTVPDKYPIKKICWMDFMGQDPRMFTKLDLKSRTIMFYSEDVHKTTF